MSRLSGIHPLFSAESLASSLPAVNRVVSTRTRSFASQGLLERSDEKTNRPQNPLPTLTLAPQPTNASKTNLPAPPSKPKAVAGAFAEAVNEASTPISTSSESLQQSPTEAARHVTDNFKDLLISEVTGLHGWINNHHESRSLEKLTTAIAALDAPVQQKKALYIEGRQKILDFSAKKVKEFKEERLGFFVQRALIPPLAFVTAVVIGVIELSFWPALFATLAIAILAFLLSLLVIHETSRVAYNQVTDSFVDEINAKYGKTPFDTVSFDPESGLG